MSLVFMDRKTLPAISDILFMTVGSWRGNMQSIFSSENTSSTKCRTGLSTK